MSDQSLQLLNGFLRFHSETGTEGGFWAFQDSRFIRQNTTEFSCTKCYAYWDKEAHPDGPPNTIESMTVTKVMPIPDDFDMESLRNGTLETPPDCMPDEHDFQPFSPTLESYEGLYILTNGDWLTIYSKTKPRKTIWSNVIKLTKYPSFTEAIDGAWIHSDQYGVERKVWAKWFTEEFPAVLVPFTKVAFDS